MKENNSESKSRVLRKRYGVKIEFHQSGMLGLYIITFYNLILRVFISGLRARSGGEDLENRIVPLDVF